MDLKQLLIEAPWIISLGFLMHLFIKTILFRFTNKGYEKLHAAISEKHPPHDVYWTMVDGLGGLKNMMLIPIAMVFMLLVIVFSLWMHFNH